MKRLIIFFSIFFIVLIQKVNVSAFSIHFQKLSDINYEKTMKQDILCLMMAYPEYIVGLEKEENNKVYIVLKSSKRVLYDDRKVKGADQKLDNPDLQDMMEQIYPLGSKYNLMEINYDPGRIRIYTLFHEVYGYSKNEIEKNLKNVNVGYRNFQFNEKNSASKALSSVMKEIVQLSNGNARVHRYIFPCSGTYNYRRISGTGRLSPHSFGIAIDLKSDKKDYWKWATRKQGEERIKGYPSEIVEIFEKNNFVWGGKWGHFDILHFEYRPEIIFKAKYFNKDKNDALPWYSGINVKNDKVMEYINKIDNALK